MKLSVITATFNAMQHLPALVHSLKNQTDKDFEWIVADGASTDGTAEYLESITDLNLKVISQEDFGIYDALNRGIKASSGEFYLVVGADDNLSREAIGNFKKNISDSVDVVTARFYMGNKVFKPTGKPIWLHSSASFVSGHAVGTIFRKTMHDEIGYYSKKYPIAADQLFMIKCYNSGYRFCSVNFIAGNYSADGLSSVDRLGTVLEIYRVLISLQYNKYLQTMLLFFRISRIVFLKAL